MKIVIESRIKKTKELKIGDIVAYDCAKYIVICVREVIGASERYSLMDLADGGYANGFYESLEELTSSISNQCDINHYSSDEYELVLQKKKKC